MSLIRNINRMIGSREFQLLDASTSRAGIFSTIGKETNENVHKRMLAWLLNPECDHGLGPQSLARLLIVAKLTHEELGLPTIAGFSLPEVAETESKEFDFGYRDKDNRRSCLKPNLSKNADLGEPVELRVSTPNHKTKNGYLDVFADFRLGKKRCLMTIEIKMDSKEHSKQLKRYADWLAGIEAPKEITRNAGSRIAIFLTRDQPETNGDPGWPSDSRWTPISWQMIHDELILPALRSPQLTRSGLTKLSQWSEVLQEIEVAIGEDERDWAESILKAHGKDIAEFNVALQDQPTPPQRCTLNLLVNHGSIPVGAIVHFKRLDDTLAEQTGTVDRGKRIGIEMNGEITSRLRDALKLAIDSYPPTWLDKILVTDENGELKSIQEYWDHFLFEFRQNLPDISEKDRTYCAAIAKKHGATIKLLQRVSSDQ
ncbi:MAG: PD-(D/E)XK nuclease family protein [Verrucomicrobiae bacterium]|nr:PD-(D/E)XK nuclease family protein [Verrucomicrobiae bacterium]